MSDDRPICVSCSLETGKVVRYRQEKTGITIPYGEYNFRYGDLFQCPVCRRGMIMNFSKTFRLSSATRTILELQNAVLKGVVDG